jgi:ATP-dependent Clp protease adaptor protein ClpS
MPKELTKTKIAPNLDVKEPSLYNVIYINDEVTTVEFVIDSLINVFDYNWDTASELTQRIHELGSSVVATLPFEIAEQKGVEVTQLARKQGFPLTIKLESAD